MRIKNPRQASPNEVKISRQGDGAVIEFTDPTISTTHFKIGPQIRQMSDQAKRRRLPGGVDRADGIWLVGTGTAPLVKQTLRLDPPLWHAKQKAAQVTERARPRP